MSQPSDMDISELERYRTLVELSPEALYVVRDDRFIYLNPAAVRLFGAREAAQLVGTPVLERVDPAFRALALSRRRRVLEDEGHAPLTVMQFLRLDGTPVDVEVHASAITFHGHRAIHVAARDITARIASEERLRQAEKLEAIGRLVGGVAHDFNNALAVILGHAEFALRSLPAGHAVRDDLEVIEQKAQQSAALTRQLLAYARKQPIRLQAVDLNAALPATLALLAPGLGETMRIVWEPGDALWPVAIDPSQLERICTNLCLNARDAHDGAGTITIGTANVTIPAERGECPPDARAGDFVRLRVRDEGRGMTAEVRRRAFEPFFTTKPIGDGAGLGLATVDGIIRQHDGFIAVESAPGQGTTVDVYLPRLTAPLEREAAAATTPGRALRGTILLVEDEPSLLRLAERALVAAGYRVRAVDDPARALVLLESASESVDLLLTDVVMPGLGGAELARRASAMRPDLPVLFMSGYAAELVASHGILDDGVHFLPKPFTLEELGRAVTRALGDEVSASA